ncbi:Epstein-Barr virus EBNA-1-like protein [Oryza sativa Japonica Group]|uniref:Epstein-Barr virus EBNA-1-like protein n=1 Tax=Oryza sativa subsp. japonica TaxID=39947 RepID=Q5N7A6_ORYSJ|nr:Epstein-Barr virus EBNA-1-like protein [Oryza sativa Japonica Group]BAD82643.1 Epstein-Barr virus EBNA-1-like protein [Oryza sativa Japonica Group]
MAWVKNGEDWEGKKGREGAWVYRTAMSVWKPTLGGQGSEPALGGRGPNGDRGGRMTPAGGKREKGGRERGLPPCHFGGKGGGREGDAAEGGKLCLRPLEARARRGGAKSMTTAMTAGRFGAEQRHGRQAQAGAAGADGGGDWPKAPTIESTAFLYVARLIASSSQNSCDLHVTLLHPNQRADRCGYSNTNLGHLN